MGYDFHRQKPLGEYIVDFFCHELMLAIEVDGVSHNQPEVIEKDRRKVQFLNSIGVTVIRFQDDEIYPNNRDALSEIERYILNHQSKETHR